METLTPEPIKPLTAEITDAEVIDGSAEKEKLLCDTEEAKDILTLITSYEKEEEFVRQVNTLKYRKHIHYWNNLQYLALNELAHDWRTPEQILMEDPQADIDPALYAKVVNVYKAHGEILIGALTAGVPTTRFFPKDADDPDDVTAAKAHSKLAEVIQRHNRARILLMKALFILYNQGMVACYNENKADYRFGTIKVPDYADVEVTNRDNYCPACGFELGSESFEPDELDPEGPVLSERACPSCGTQVQPDYEDTPGTEQRQVGEKSLPKNRECLEVWGPLNVKIPMWCRDQFSTPYLILETEEHVSLLREIYPEIADKIQGDAYPDSYDKETRIPSSYRSDMPRNLVTVQRVWLRPWALNLEAGGNNERIKATKEKFKKGLYVVILNHNLVAEMVEDNMDEHWTISENPLSETLHAEPIGATMVPMQDITNELANLTLETVEFGIPEVFADSRVLDFETYPRQEARPGQISPATAPAGQGLSSGFHEIKVATLSKEVELFADRTFNMSQFVMGSYPSIYGGPTEGIETAKGQEMSKASALQRLSTTWNILQEWWVRVIEKSVRSFVKNMKGDESYVKGKGNSFVNVWVKRSEFSGEVGDVEPEVTETFPVSWTQKRDVILNLIQMQNEDIASVIRHPENASLIAAIIGVPELYIPGDDSRNKQLYEIARMLREEPQEVPADPMMMQQAQMMGMPPPPPTMQSSIPVDQELDEHPVEAEVCKAWLRSEVGLDAKETNPGGYANVLAHMKEHDILARPPMPAPMPGQEGGEEQMAEQVGA
jgi:hypothetical protein